MGKAKWDEWKTEMMIYYVKSFYQNIRIEFDNDTWTVSSVYDGVKCRCKGMVLRLVLSDLIWGLTNHKKSIRFKSE